MSDPVTNVEIEDILSSIRRLVSDEDRSDEAGEKSEDNRLVLTPSLRVNAPDDTDEDEEPGADDGSSTEGRESDEAEAVKDTTDMEYPASDAEDAANEVDQDGLRARIAALEDSVATRADQWEPDGPSDDDYAGGPVEALPWEDHFEDGDDPEERAAEGGAQAAQYADDHSDDELAAAEGFPLADEAVDFAEVQRERTEDLPPEDGEPDAHHRNDLGAEQGTASAEISELFGGDDAILDEEALREVIADIVRQELQGSLGERITRNVRKLVRREIHRALASHDLE